MDCPRCGAETHDAPECPRCGVLVRKARPPRVPHAEPARPNDLPAWRALLLPTLGLVVLVSAAVVYLRRAGPAQPSSVHGSPPPPPPAQTDTGERVSLPELATVAPPAPEPPPLAPGVPKEDVAAAERLVARLGREADMAPDDLRSAEDLYSRYPQQAAELLSAVLVRTALQAQRERRYAPAAAQLERALTVTPGSGLALRALLSVRVDQADWPAVERVARDVLGGTPGDAETTRMLAYALVRQDRTREAIELLTRHLDGHRDPAVAGLLARIQQDQAAEAGLGQQTLSHFHVRYDGAAHENVGREVLRVLERHYVTLAQTLSHQPAEPIPVILLSEQSYYDSTGAPAWAGGHHDSFDGRIRIPIADLTTSLGPELDETLLHELTHAFVADLSAGLAPREIHEGVAQLLAGHRGAARLDEQELRALASGQLDGVTGFYLGSLAFVEDLVAQRGQGGINDLLAAMARTRNVDAAFREVYGKGMRALQADTATRLRLRYGS